jgi:hypothetical protein
MGRQQWQFEESLYAFGETLLFRPTLPHALFDQRSDKANVRPKDRRDKPEVVMGLGQRPNPEVVSRGEDGSASSASRDSRTSRARAARAVSPRRRSPR